MANTHHNGTRRPARRTVGAVRLLKTVTPTGNQVG